jgi:hypothetical protein
MSTLNISRSIVRLAAAVAVLVSLALSSGIAAADGWHVGFNECDLGGCAVVTIDDLREAQVKRDLDDVQPIRFPAGPFDPRFIR